MEALLKNYRAEYELLPTENGDVAKSSKPSTNTFEELVPLRLRNKNYVVPTPTPEEIDECYNRTKAAMDDIMAKKAKGPGSQDKQESKFVRYISSGLESSSSRVIQIVDKVVDPLLPSQYKVKKTMSKTEANIEPVLHSIETKKLSAEEQKQWYIPPAVSNWKNPNGYTIALDKRLAVDARYNGENNGASEISDGFVKLADALDSADKKAREEVKMRAEIKKQEAEKAAREKEAQLRLLAQRARQVRNDPEEQRREDIRRQKRRDFEQETSRGRMSVLERTKALARDAGREISDRVALGIAKPTSQSTQTVVQHDSRLYSKGANAAATRSEDQLYDNPLFVQEGIDNIYRPRIETSAEQTLEELQKESRFDLKRSREDGPVEFSKGDSLGGGAEASDYGLKKQRKQESNQ